MKKIINIFCFLILLDVFFCCRFEGKDSYYFNGKIVDIDSSEKITKSVVSRPISLDGTHTGMVAAYDSLLIFWYPRFSNHFFNVFNVDTGEELGYYCEKGQGPNEAISVNCIFQFFKKNGNLMTMLYTYEGKLFFWNISQSIKQKRTVYDSIISYENDRMFFHFYKTNDTLFSFKASDYFSIEKISTPLYEKRTILTNELIDNYFIYKEEFVQNKNVETIDFFYTWDAIRPDGSKIVQAMWHLPQLNVLDSNTGDIIGYRISHKPDFSILNTDLKSLKIYYNSVQADNNYIYATYWGKDPWVDHEGTEAPFLNTIHVYNWNGKLLYELIADRSFFRSIWLDHARNRLYSMDVNTDEVYYLDLDEYIY